MKELKTYLKHRIIEKTNLELTDMKEIKLVHNTIIKYLDKTFKKIIENPKSFQEVKESIINEICYNTFILVDYEGFNYLLVDYLNAYYA